MSNTTSMNLGDHFTGFLNSLTASGRYGSVSEAVRAGLRLLEEEEKKFYALESALDEGEISGESDENFQAIVEKSILKCREHS